MSSASLSFGQLPRLRFSLGDVHRLVVVQIRTVVFPVMYVRRIAAHCTPAHRTDALESAVQKNGFRIGIRAAVVDGSPRQFCGAGPAFAEYAVEKNIPVIGRRVADPHENAVRLQFASVEESRTSAKNRVSVAHDQTVGYIDRAVNLQ